MHARLKGFKLHARLQRMHWRPLHGRLPRFALNVRLRGLKLLSEWLKLVLQLMLLKQRLQELLNEVRGSFIEAC